MRRLCIGLTGGIGAGKSTAARAFQELGASVINVDAIGHLVLERNSPEYEKIIKVFGQEIVGSDESINRSQLGAIVFNSKSQLAKLESMTHPGINKRLLKLLQDQSTKVVILDMAVLVEKPLAQIDGKPLYSKVIVVEASIEHRLSRLKLRGHTEEDALARIQSQVTDEKRREIADLVIVNDGSLEQLRAEVSTYWEIITQWM